MTFIHAVRRLLFVAAVVGAVAFANSPAAAHDAGIRHVTLERSSPAAGDTLAASPDSLLLWFSVPVELRLTRIRLLAGDRELRTGAAARAAGEKAVVKVTVAQPLAPGEYTVAWKTAGSDGHPATGTYAFVVRAAR